jgi:hypothetical protein
VFHNSPERKPLPARAEREARAADEALLTSRLERLGIQFPVTVHENSTVLVSYTEGGGLRIHRGYAYASDRTLKAVVTFIGSSRRPPRKEAEQEVVAFPVGDYVQVKRRRRRKGWLKPGDRRLLADLGELHKRLNHTYFAGALTAIEFRISDRMRTRLGELSVDPESGHKLEIGINRRHLLHDPWDDVQHTVLHEMIHQWQAERGMKLDHGPAFREKAKEIGVLPRAHRTV